MDQYKTRQDIPEKHKWNLNLIYPSSRDWEDDFAKLESAIASVERFKGHLARSAKDLLDAFEEQSKLDLLIEKLYSYAHHLSDEDTRNSENLGRVDRIRSRAAEAGARLSWMDPELLETPIEVLKKFHADPVLVIYARRIELLIRSKPHQRSAEVEEVLSLAAEPLGGAYKAFSLLENADMKIPHAKDAEGKDHELNHATYSACLESPDRVLRKNAFETYFGAYAQYQNTFAATLDAHVKKQIFYSKTRRFSSAIEASLFSDQIPVSVYNGLISTVHQHLPLLHRWVSLKKRELKLAEMNVYDLFYPMVKPAKVEIPYDEGCRLVAEAVKPLGEEYVRALESAFHERWIDVYYTPGKRGGAYSGGMYTSKPYILLNHKNNLNSTFTLAHELGHSLHSFYSNRYQPYSTASYPIFLAEVASTTNEMLLHFHLNERAQDKEMRLYLLDHLFTQFRGTLFRQVQFAEFERDIHAMAERGEPLTAQTLSDTYAAIQSKFYGPEMVMHDLVRYEWTRIPHFYYNFYVYKYSTSFAAAQYFAKKIFEGDLAVRDRYLEFLKSGSSRDPLDTLRHAGVDLGDSKPIEAAFKVFEEALDEYERL
ncbi:MAG: oligoendopeptidase F [Bdellovibrionales bacterium]|nr:oligoendopeptidase F [Bdellovibrionales bacterium]